MVLRLELLNSGRLWVIIIFYITYLTFRIFKALNNKLCVNLWEKCYKNLLPEITSTSPHLTWFRPSLSFIMVSSILYVWFMLLKEWYFTSLFIFACLGYIKDKCLIGSNCIIPEKILQPSHNALLPIWIFCIGSSMGH